MLIEGNSQEIKIVTNFNKVVVFVHYDEFYSSIAENIDKLLDDLKGKYPDVFNLEELQILKASQ